MTNRSNLQIGHQYDIIKYCLSTSLSLTDKEAFFSKQKTHHPECSDIPATFTGTPALNLKAEKYIHKAMSFNLLQLISSERVDYYTRS